MYKESNHKSEINSKIKETIYLLNSINLLNNIKPTNNNNNKTLLKFISFVKAIIHPLNILDFRTIEYVMKT